MRDSEKVSNELAKVAKQLNSPKLTAAFDSIGKDILANSKINKAITDETLSIVTNYQKQVTPAQNSIAAIAGMRSGTLEAIAKTRSFHSAMLANVATAKVFNRQLMEAANGAVNAVAFMAAFTPQIKGQLKDLASLIVDLRSFHGAMSLDLHTTVKYDLQKATDLNEREETTLQTNVTTTNTYGTLSFQQTAELNVTARLERIEDNQLEIQQKLNKLDTIEAMLRNGSHKIIPARVQTLEFIDEQPPILTINGKDVKLEADSLQSRLCKVLFGSKESLTKKLHTEEIFWILESIELSPSEVQEYYKKFYQAARHINDKVARKLGIEEKLILPDKQYFMVNPKLLNL